MGEHWRTQDTDGKEKKKRKRPPVLLSVRYHIETGNLIFSRHIKVHSLPADRDHYSLSVTTRHADYVAKSLLLILFRRRLEERKVPRREEGREVILLHKDLDEFILFVGA